MAKPIYWLASGALRLASIGALPRVYRLATRLRSGGHVSAGYFVQALWCLEDLPERPCRLLDLGTGWVHAYGLAAALVRDADQIDLFDVHDLRHWGSFQATLEATIGEILGSTLPEDVKQRAVQRAKNIQKADSFEAAYAIAHMTYHCGSANPFPPATFDRIFSVDVLEHVDADIFLQAAQSWYDILKPGGMFVAQVGLDDHTAMYSDGYGTKRYLRYSETTWRILLGNSVQYINRLPASAIVSHLKNVGFGILSVETHDCTMQRSEVHTDYHWQSDADIQAVRLFVRARKPE
jgi:SAM-dependent methyltransferase